MKGSLYEASSAANRSYDYIIAGAGCAGLSLAVHIIRSGRLTGKRILIVDKEEKNRNDRTWCFWETTPGLFESIVYRNWSKVWIYGDGFSKALDLSPYRYKLVRGIDFYNYCLDLVRQQPNIELERGEISDIASTAEETSIVVNGKKIHAGYIFNSLLLHKPVLKKNEYWLLQHFKGWLIETGHPVFKPDEATLMDFRTDQQHGTAFIYCMPFSATHALVEYTLFTNELLQPEQYDAGLKEYIGKWLNAGSYRVTGEEFGAIPMTNHRFRAHTGNIINIGTAGGQTKASSGYTFSFIQKHAAAITERLARDEPPFVPFFKRRFHFYDSTLLYILHHRALPGSKIFTDLFQKNNPARVLRFLDNESTISDDLRIISSLPTLPFLRAAFQLR